MIKKMMLLASVTAIAMAFAVPTIASAKWADGTVALALGNNPNISLEGSTGYNGTPGAFSCSQTTTAIQLTGGTSNAHVTNFTVDNPQSCLGSGAFAFCTLTSTTMEKAPWAAHTNTTDITITNARWQYHFSGGFCSTPTTTFEGNATLTISGGEQHAVKAVQVGGSFTLSSGGSDFGIMTLSGTWSMTPSGTYGLT